MNKLTRISATVASSVALVAGFAGIAGASSIDQTGNRSENRITHRNEVRNRVNNTNDVRLTNNNPQYAGSGHVTTSRNTTAGTASSGEAVNDSLVDASVDVDNGTSTQAAATNTGGAGAVMPSNNSISNTGADSLNRVSSENDVRTRINNDNMVRVTNNNEQTAVSGDVTARRNTTVGNVTSGDASNVSTVTVDVSVSN